MKKKLVQLTFYQYDTVMCRIDRWFHHVEEHQWRLCGCKLTYPPESNTVSNCSIDRQQRMLKRPLITVWLGSRFGFIFTLIVFLLHSLVFFCGNIYFSFTLCSPAHSSRLKAVDMLSTTFLLCCCFQLHLIECEQVRCFELWFCVWFGVCLSVCLCSVARFTVFQSLNLWWLDVNSFQRNAHSIRVWEQFTRHNRVTVITN